MNRDYLKIGKHFPPGNPYLERNAERAFQQKMSKLPYCIEDKVKYCLSLFGWTGENRPEAEQIIQNMEQLKYYIFPAAYIFLNRFAGLRISYSADGFKIPFVNTFDIYDFCFCEALQAFKDELLVPVATLDEMDIFWGESGKVHYWNSDRTGIIPGDMFSFLSSMLFGLEKDIWFSTTPEDRKEVPWWDEDLLNDIETKVNNGNYIPYAQRRFIQNGGIPNPVMATDAFTQWLLSLD